MTKLDEEAEAVEERRVHAGAAKLSQHALVVAAADRFFALVVAHATDPAVAKLAAGVALDFAVKRREDRDREHEQNRLKVH